MTAEVAILTRSAVAMAADSAATYGRGENTKVFSSANKIFTLSKRHPVGIMIYGNAEFMITPWETLIKHYREQLGATVFASLPEYAEAFLKFVRSEKNLVTPIDEEKYALESIYGYLSLIEADIHNAVKKRLEEVDDIAESEVHEIVDANLGDHEQRWATASMIAGVSTRTRARIAKEVKGFLDKLIPMVFEELLTPAQERRLRKLAECVLLKWSDDLEHDQTSGIVIAGFGQDDLFPRLRSYSVLGRFSQVLQFAESDAHRVDIGSERGEAIVPFAQTDVVMTFLTGIAPEYRETLEHGFAEIFNGLPDLLLSDFDELSPAAKTAALTKTKRILNETLRKTLKTLQDFRFEHYVRPVISVLNGLPKDELANMTESLVSLTSLRRRMSLGPDSVGGPIDVAVISKGDGFIWTRRKHYFKTELNHQFLANYNKEC